MQLTRFTPTVPGLAILGVGGHARVVGDMASLHEHWQSIDFFYDLHEPDAAHWPERRGWRVVGSVKDLLRRADRYSSVCVAIGNSEVRLCHCDRLRQAGFSLATIVHPAAVISREASIGEGTVVMAGSVINAGVLVGEASIVNSGATVDHDCVLGRGVHVGPGVNLSGAVRIGEGSWIGIGACVRELIQIGLDVTVGAGAVVVKSLPDYTTAFGNPARVVEPVDGESVTSGGGSKSLRPGGMVTR